MPIFIRTSLFLFCIVFLISCESNTFYCSTKHKILKTDKAAPIIELNLNHTNEAMLQTIETAFDDLDSVCNYSPIFYVPFDFENRIIANVRTASLVPFRVFSYCPDDFVRQGNRYNLQVLINESDQVLMLGDYVERDNFKNKLQEWYEGDKEETERARQETTFSITYDNALPQDNLIADIQALTEAYLHCAERFAQAEFSAALCDLSQNEIEMIQQKMPFQILLPLNVPLPPPPPPLD